MSEIHRQHYQELKQALDRLSQTVSPAALDRDLLKEQLTQVQQCFQADLSLPEADELEAALAQKILSYRTEIHKQLRLLGMDVMFLQAARQAITARKRQQQMAVRLQQLIGYCEGILQAI